ncbi:MAG: glycosyltransferase family 4 protein [Candidatus Eremiobacteraeota bacterium]|nr:glycosyltransferase family 4 protein [Candidatus Eremiobacteraeota bacterium]
MRLLLDARCTRRMSRGMCAYVAQLGARLPRVAPDIALQTYTRGDNFSLTEQIELPRAAAAHDLVHYPTIFAPLFRRRPYVLTIHDLIHLRYPQLFRLRTAVFYRAVVRRLARGATRILVGDERTADDCTAFLGVEARRVRVVPLGYDPELLEIAPAAAARPYVLYVGNHRAHKNLPLLIEAWTGLPDGVELDLFLTGNADLAVPQSSARRVVFLGDLTAEDVASRIAGAAALVHPALAEGFGLPILEALVRRTPVVASETSTPRALAPFVATFPAGDVAALRSLLEEVARSPQRLERLAAEGEPIARAYTWDRFAASTASVYREAWEDCRCLDGRR